VVKRGVEFRVLIFLKLNAHRACVAYPEWYEVLLVEIIWYRYISGII
jgi:hypothetical protein